MTKSSWSKSASLTSPKLIAAKKDICQTSHTSFTEKNKKIKPKFFVEK